MEAFEELFALSDRLKKRAEQIEERSVKLPIEAIEKAATKVARSFSGSWLGYHAYVYYAGLAPPPPGAHFSQEWGFNGNEFLGLGCTGDWQEYDPESVKEYILAQAGNPTMDEILGLERVAQKDFETSKADLASILNAEVDNKPDTFLTKLLTELAKLKVSSANEVIEAIRPRGQFATRDAVVIGQGTRTPPHISVLSQVYAIRHTFSVCAEAAKIAANAASHVERQQKKKRHAERIGTNVFIGHGRSSAWREVKDFVQDRLGLPWDEFNRVPVAGVTNIARLSEMLDASAIAFLVMTAEDEMADGALQARMNVIHEAGLFQGRLGFARAIILLEEGCSEFSNVQGLGQIRFPKGNVGAAFEELRRVLEREGLVSSD